MKGSFTIEGNIVDIFDNEIFDELRYVADRKDPFHQKAISR